MSAVVAQPRILMTSGEPAGIGPDLVLQIALAEHHCKLAVLADIDMLRERAILLAPYFSRPIQIEQIDTVVDCKSHRAGTLQCIAIACAETVVPGQLNRANSAAVLAQLEYASHVALSHDCDAIVTAPVQKSILDSTDKRFIGHTEFFSARANTEVVMLLVAGTLRVALATTHLPLRDVPNAITQTGLRQSIQVLHRELQYKFGIDTPRIMVLGLNPHAGESGHLGREEIDTIEPVLAELRAQGMQLLGPAPADTGFTPKLLQQVDAVLAMYHDQGLPVLKYSGFGKAVNISLGLPYVRTSVDHGTALDLAGTGDADSGSLFAALELAQQLALRTMQGKNFPKQAQGLPA